MLAELCAFEFMFRSMTKNYSQVRQSEGVLNLASQNLHYLQYSPALGKKNRGALLLIHGFSLKGNRDERMVNLAKSWASVGFEVFLPAFEDLAKLNMTPQIIEDIRACIQAIDEDQKLNPSGKLGLFVPSFSAGMSLIACSTPDVQTKVSALCSIGTYSNIYTSLDFLTAKKSDDYALLILFRNFLHTIIGENEQISRAIQIAIEDNAFHRKEAQLPAYIAQIDEANRQYFCRLMEDAQLQRELLLLIMDKNKHLLDQINVLDKLGDLQTPITLIHGKADAVIPASESSSLYARLKSMRTKAKLVITPLLDHGDIQINISIVKDFLELWAGFSFFLRNAIAR